jgi:hypothetical protein
MEEIDSLVRELRLDWEGLLTEDYNPLRQALRNRGSSTEASSFRNIFHKVEKAMEQIIEMNYKGFSDSVLSYMEAYNLNRRCMEAIGTMIRTTDELLNIKIAVKDMAREFGECEFYETKHRLCSVLMEISDRFNDLCAIKERFKGRAISPHGSFELVEAAENANKIYECIEAHELMRIPCIQKFRREVDVEVNDFLELIHGRLGMFIFHNRGEYQEDFRCVVALHSLLELDRHHERNFEREYEGLIEDTIRSVDRSPGTDKLDVLMKSVAAKTVAVVRNVDTMRQRALSSFEGVAAKSRSSAEKEEPMLKIYGPEGEGIVNEKIQRVLEKFISEYTEKPEDFHDTGTFTLENIVDDIEYASLFDTKYLIHERITGTEAGGSASKKGFTRICTPTLKAAVIMHRYAFNDGLRSYLERLLKDRYVRQRQEQIRKKMIYLFQNSDWFKSDYSNKRLLFYHAYQECISDLVDLPEFCGVSAISEFLGGFFERKFNDYLTIKFRSGLIREIVEDEGGKASRYFKRLLSPKAIDRADLCMQIQYCENVLFALATLRDINEVLRNERMRRTEERLRRAFRWQFILEVMYYFDLFYREGRYVDPNDYYIHKILQIVEVFCGSLPADPQAEDLFGCLNFYVQNNVEKLNIRSARDLQNFNQKLKLLNEVLGMIESESGLKESIDFISETISNSSVSVNSRKLRSRIQE